MMKYIALTSIQPPTGAVKKFAALKDFKLIVAGDRKTPATWKCGNTVFLSIADQAKLGYRLTKSLPYDHYCRKMTAYIYAAKNGADMIVDTDDDNIPLSGWTFPEFNGRFPATQDDLGFINIYRSFTKQNIWPRGLPLKLVAAKQPPLKTSRLPVRIGVWQGLADEDPDVDAIYRLTINKPCYFSRRAPVVLGKGTVSPFNSQNTMFRKELFPLMYLPAHVTFRFTDILRGLIAQPIMWAAGYRLGFTGATVIQKRNPHDYMKDFESEIPCYLKCEKVVNIATEAVKKARPVADNLYSVYSSLTKNGIVEGRELRLLELWLKDIA